MKNTGTAGRRDPASFPPAIRLRREEGTLTLEGEVATIAEKKTLAGQAAALDGVTTIVDHIRVAPSRRMQDDEMRDAVRDALLDESVFAESSLRVLDDGDAISVHRAASPDAGSIDVEVTDGVVVLRGRQRSLEHKRLAGVLAWWVPGTRDVVNEIAVEPAEADSDDQITDAVRIALEKDPLLDADAIRVRTRERAVTLEGVVATSTHKHLAESDAWYVLGVERVFDFLEAVEQRS